MARFVVMKTEVNAKVEKAFGRICLHMIDILKLLLFFFLFFKFFSMYGG